MAVAHKPDCYHADCDEDDMEVHACDQGCECQAETTNNEEVE